MAKSHYPGVESGRGWGVAAIVCALMMCFASGARAQQAGGAAAAAAEKKKHGHADTKMPFVHRIFLLDEQGNPIKFRDPKDPSKPNPDARPYSPQMTCGKCHEISEIDHGWHFNYVTGNMPAGRKSEPWLWQDATTKTILPLSYRGWAGTFDPRKIGISDWQFVMKFGTHLPGGGVGMNPTTQPVDKTARWTQSGKLQIDCMICHSARNSYDPTDRELQLRTQNLRYSPTRAYGLGVVRGSVQQTYEDAEAEGGEVKGEAWLKVSYDLNKITPDDRVFLDVVARPPASSCYYCHTTMPGGADTPPKWHGADDVHISAGLNCADCHRNGIEHHTVRGYEGEARDRNDPAVSAYTCAGCHLGNESASEASVALGGTHGSPRPEHKGFPPIHFEKLACTACHSGPYPGERTTQFQTAMAHKLGVESFTRTREDQPHIVGPVFLKGHDGKIAPHKMVWPNYWGRLKGETVEPISITQLATASKGILPAKKETAPDAWTPLTEEQIGKMLEKLATVPATGAAPARPATTQPTTQAASAPPSDAGVPVYVSGGKVYRRGADGKISTENHRAAEPYAWAMGHDVRPASQSLGVRGCADCHSSDAPIYFGNVVTLGPIPAEQKVANAMYRFRPEEDITVAKTFAATFAFRNGLKIAAFGAAAIIAGVILLYFLRGLAYLSSRGK